MNAPRIKALKRLEKVIEDEARLLRNAGYRQTDSVYDALTALFTAVGNDIMAAEKTEETPK